MPLYPVRALERAMKIKEVITRAMSGQFTWSQAAEIIGITDRSMRRWRKRLSTGGYEYLLADTAAQRETNRRGGRGESLEVVPREIFRPECEALRGEAARGARHRAQLHLDEDGTAECGTGEA